MNTKENILLIALRLFAQKGYESVSVEAIANKIGVTKGALYRHYKNKRDIFDSIVKKMEQMDAEYAQKSGVPEETAEQAPDEYKNISPEQIVNYTELQFIYWTEKEFSSLFRKMLTIEQYHDQEMSGLHQQYLASGPIEYVSDLFLSITHQKDIAEQLALEFYSPVFLLYSVYDGATDKKKVTDMLQRHLSNFKRKLSEYEQQGKEGCK